MRLGLLGGTFNPIHLGHLRAAEEIRENIHLDRIAFIPSALPPHKKVEPSVTAADRLEMVRRAVAGNPFFEVSEVEIKRPGPSYTVETLRHFQKSADAAIELYFIVGVDAFLEIHTWKSYKELFQLSHFVVLARPGGPRTLEQFLTDHIAPEYRHDPEGDCYLHSELCTVFFHTITSLDISSTKIRSLVHERRSIRYLVPEVVEEYIIKKGLYT